MKEFFASFAPRLLIYAVLLFISLIAGWTLNKKTPKYNKENKKRKIIVTVLLTVFFVWLALLGVPLLLHIKYVVLALILLYASLCDMDTREVSDSISVMLLIAGFIDITGTLLVRNFFAVLFLFGLMFICGMVAVGKIGGADIKISGAATFALGAQGGFIGLITGMIAGLVMTPILNRKKEKEEKKTMALVPYLSFGYLSYVLVSQTVLYFK